MAVVAQRISGTAGPSTLGLTVLATEYRMGGGQRWLPFGSDDMRISASELVAGRPGLVMSSRASTNRGVSTGAEPLDRTLVLAPIGFAMRALNVEVGAMSRNCNGHSSVQNSWEPGYIDPTIGTHSTVDALRFFVGADIYRDSLAMDEPAGRLEKFATSTTTTFTTRLSTPAASFASVDRESALSEGGNSTVQIGHHNHCAGLLYPRDGNSWTPWVATRTVFGPISFDVEFGTA